MLLAIDTATIVSAVALVDGDRVLAEVLTNNKKTHSELLMPHIEQLFAMIQAQRCDVTAVAVSIGPGSFTGLRIGLATAKALAYVWQVPLIGVPTLAAQAYGCAVPGCLLCPLLDAQKGNVYQALYRWQDEELLEITAPRVAHHEEALEQLAAGEDRVIMLGEGSLMYQDAIRSRGQVLHIAPPHLVISRAASVALLGSRLLSKGLSHDPMVLEPLYIRRSEAEVLWERRQERG